MGCISVGVSVCVCILPFSVSLILKIHFQKSLSLCLNSLWILNIQFFTLTLSGILSENILSTSISVVSTIHTSHFMKAFNLSFMSNGSHTCMFYGFYLCCILSYFLKYHLSLCSSFFSCVYSTLIETSNTIFPLKKKMLFFILALFFFHND